MEREPASSLLFVMLRTPCQKTKANKMNRTVRLQLAIATRIDEIGIKGCSEVLILKHAVGLEQLGFNSL